MCRKWKKKESLPKEEQKSDSTVTEDNGASFSEFCQEKPIAQEFYTQSKKQQQQQKQNSRVARFNK